MSTDLPQDIAGALLLNTYTSRSTSLVRPLPPPPPPTHSDTSSALVMSPCHTQTCPMPSDVPVGQSHCIFDLHTHNFDGSLHRSRTHPLDPLFDSIDSYDRSLSSHGLPDPLCMIWIGLHFTHIACKILFEMSSTHIPTNNSRNQPPPQNKNTHERGLYLSHTPT